MTCLTKQDLETFEPYEATEEYFGFSSDLSKGVHGREFKDLPQTDIEVTGKELFAEDADLGELENRFREYQIEVDRWRQTKYN